MEFDGIKKWKATDNVVNGNDLFEKMFMGQWKGVIKPKTYYPYGIKTIQVNEKKKLVTVVFDYGKVEIVKCSKEDKFDINIGVAIAITNHYFGSKTQFHKFVEKKAKFVK